MSKNGARKTKVIPQARSVYTSLRMPREMRQRLEEIAREEERSVSKVAVRCIQDGLAVRPA